MSKLEKDFYNRSNVVKISQDLLGKVLCSNIEGCLTSGIIVETEAYKGATDEACHAYKNKRTKRTEVFFNPGGISYVYLCYGIHHLFNVITNNEKQADAILIRALEPLIGIDHMLQRRKMEKVARKLTAGPGILSEAMGIKISHNGLDLRGDKIWIEDQDIRVKKEYIIADPRVGCEYAGESGYLPWRFRIKDNSWTSPGKSKLTLSK